MGVETGERERLRVRGKKILNNSVLLFTVRDCVATTQTLHTGAEIFMPMLRRWLIIGIEIGKPRRHEPPTC